MRLRRLLLWSITVAWAALIFSFSTEPFGSAASESILTKGLDSIGVTAAVPTLDILDSITRTTAHLTEYAVFGTLLYASFWRPADGIWRPALALRCLAIAAAYAFTDEFHQRFVIGRHASLLDCSLDTLGSGLAMCIIYGWSRRYYRHSRNRSVL